MNDDEITSRSDKKKKKLFLVTTIIIIVVIFSSFYVWNKSQVEPEKEDVDISDNIDKIEFMINMENSLGFENISIYWQIKNVGNNTYNYTVPVLGNNLNFYIIAANGTVYQYAHSDVTVLPLWKDLSPGEIKSGIVRVHLFRINIFYTGENYTHWQNSTTREYWFFQPGTYEIYGEYESLVPNNDNINDAIVGIWYSNVITFSIK